MATFTANYNIRKPAGSDLVDVVTDIDAGMDTIDTLLKALRDDTDDHSADIIDLRADWASYNSHVRGGGVDFVPGNGVISSSYKLLRNQTVFFNIRVSAGTTTNFQSGTVSFDLPLVTNVMGGNGGFIMLGPQKQGSWRNNTPSTTQGVLLEGGTSTLATVASLGLAAPSTELWISGMYRTF